MLKFFLLIAVCGLVQAAPKHGMTWESAWSAIPLPLNGSQCLYVSELSQFSCRGHTNDFITCDAVKHLPGVPNKLFGLGRVAPSSEEHENTVFGLYPKQLQAITNETVYLNNTWEFVDAKSQEEKEVCLSVYHAEDHHEEFFGIRVPDVKCYQRIVAFLDTITHEEHAEIFNIENEKSTEKVILIGEVFIVEEVKVRRGFGGGLGGGGLFGSIILLSLLGGGGMGGGFGFGGPFLG